ncbi:MAG: hypothetical protein OEQ18_17150 [Gammaproteobacteria bacterium]|nr:hypothetical protein [Gammaproteobacteria bacterium]
MNKRNSTYVTAPLLLLSFTLSQGALSQGIPQTGRNPEPAPLLFLEEWNAEPLAQPITAEHLSNPDLTLHLYGDVNAIRKSAHRTENYTYTGEAVTNWGLTLSDPEAVWDLSRNGMMMLKTRNSGFRRTHIMLKTADGNWYVSEEGNPESTFWIEREYILEDLHWRNLMMTDTPSNASNRREPIAGHQPIVPTSVGTPDLNQVVEIGFTDLMPGGWIPSASRVKAWAVYGQRVSTSEGS